MNHILITLADKGQLQAYNMSHDSKYDEYPMWALHETMSLLHHYLLIDIYDDDAINTARGLYEMLDEEKLVEFADLQSVLHMFLEISTLKEKIYLLEDENKRLKNKLDNINNYSE